MNRAAEVLRSQKAAILAKWELETRRDSLASRNQPERALQNLFPKLVDEIIEALECGSGVPSAEMRTEMARHHAALRADANHYDLAATIAEYTLLRNTLLDALREAGALTVGAFELVAQLILEGTTQASIAFAHIKSDQERRALDQNARLIEDLRHERALREQFVSSLTHDLRQPLNAAMLHAQIIARGPDRTAGAIAAKMQSVLGKASRLVTDLLDVTLVQTGHPLPMHLSECNLGDILRAVLAEMAALHGDRFVLTGSDVNGIWDCSLIERAVQNLVNNAVKYGASETQVGVHVLDYGDTVEIQVHNLGKPIPPEDLQRIFEPFGRAGYDRGLSTGWGLGLSLVRAVAKAHGGCVAVSSSEKHGTRFSIRIPKTVLLPATEGTACESHHC